MTESLSSEIHQFSDDTNIVMTSSDPVSAIETINRDLNTLSQWAEQWRVTFNASKTYFMVISLKKQKPIYGPILLNNTTLKETNEIKSLGLTITNNLSWQSHIFNLIKKASIRLFILNKYKYILPRSALITIYLSLIRPILEYGDVIYDSAPLSTVQPLENLQRQAALACSGAYRHTKHQNLLNELGWEPLTTRRLHHKLIVFFK